MNLPNSQNPSFARSCRAGLASMIAIAAALSSQPAFAQAAEQTTPANGGQVPTSQAAAADIVVTGSRLGRNSFTAPNPVTVIGAQEIQQLGLTNVGAVIAQLPQNSNFFSVTMWAWAISTSARSWPTCAA